MKISHIHISTYMVKQATLVRGLNAVKSWALGARPSAAAKGLGSFERYPSLMAARRKTTVIPNARSSSFPGPGTWGQYRPKDDLLLVRGGLTPAAARQTLRHELTHLAQLKAPRTWLDKVVQNGLTQPGNNFKAGLRSILAEFGARTGETKGFLAPVRGALKLWETAPSYARTFEQVGARAAALPYRILTAAPIIGGLTTTGGLGLKLKSMVDQRNQPKSR